MTSKLDFTVFVENFLSPGPGWAIWDKNFLFAKFCELKGSESENAIKNHTLKIWSMDHSKVPFW